MNIDIHGGIGYGGRIVTFHHGVIVMSISEDRRQYVQDNREKFLYYAAKQRDKLKEEMVAAYGGKCIDCGEADPIVLVLDHINDDAHIEKDLYGENSRGGHKHYQRLKALNWPKDRFQLLCANCNTRKEHKRRRNGIVARNGEPIEADRVLVQAKIGIKKHNTSGIKGVFWNSQKKKWHARIMINYRMVHLGFFSDIAEAARKYRAAALATWGNNANVPSDVEIEAVASQYRNAAAELDKNPEELGL